MYIIIEWQIQNIWNTKKIRSPRKNLIMSQERKVNTKYLKYQENKAIKVKPNCFGEKVFL